MKTGLLSETYPEATTHLTGQAVKTVLLTEPDLGATTRLAARLAVKTVLLSEIELSVITYSAGEQVTKTELFNFYLTLNLTMSPAFF